MQAQTPRTLPGRDILVASAKDVIEKYDATCVWKKEETVLSGVAFGALVAWVNTTCANEPQRSFMHTPGMIAREFFDQVYRKELT